MAILMDHEWPGNVRELENILEHAMVCSRTSVIEPEALPRSLFMGQAIPVTHPPKKQSAGVPAILAPDAERETILRALESSRWNRGLAAAHLRIDRTTLWRKMRRFGIAPPDH
jgi:transcriptional regulator of acetoin/glycerol metabolism